MERRPLLGLVAGILRDYQPLWENFYFYSKLVYQNRSKLIDSFCFVTTHIVDPVKYPSLGKRLMQQLKRLYIEYVQVSTMKRVLCTWWC